MLMQGISTGPWEQKVYYDSQTEVSTEKVKEPSNASSVNLPLG